MSSRVIWSFAGGPKQHGTMTNEGKYVVFESDDGKHRAMIVRDMLATADIDFQVKPYSCPDCRAPMTGPNNTCPVDPEHGQPEELSHAID